MDGRKDIWTEGGTEGRRDGRRERRIDPFLQMRSKKRHSVDISFPTQFMGTWVHHLSPTYRRIFTLEARIPQVSTKDVNNVNHSCK